MQEDEQFSPGVLNQEVTPKVTPEIDPEEEQLLPGATPWLTFDLQKGIRAPLVGDIAVADFPLLSQYDIMDARADRTGTFMPTPGGSDDYFPTEEELQATVEKYGLSSRAYRSLLRARSPQDLDIIGDGLERKYRREERVAQSTGGFAGLSGRLLVNVLDPSFIVAGGVAGKALGVGTAATRTGNAFRAAGASGIGDFSVEAVGTGLDDDRSIQGALAAGLASATLGYALGGLQRGLSSKDVVEIDKQAAKIVTDGYREYSGGSVGAAQLRPIITEEPDGTYTIENAPGRAEIKIPFTSFGIPAFGTPANQAARSPDEIIRTLNGRLTFNTFTDGVQEQTAYEAQRRIFEAGTTYRREHRRLAGEYYKARGETQALGGITDDQAEQFNILVAQHHAGVRISEDPNIIAASKNLSDDLEDTLMYVKDTNYLGKGVTSEGGRSHPDFEDVEHDSSYFPRLFSKDGFRQVQRMFRGPTAKEQLRRLGDRFAKTILRSNADRIDELVAAHRKAFPNSNMTALKMSQRIGRAYINTVDAVVNKTGNPRKNTGNFHSGDRDEIRKTAMERLANEDVDEILEDILDLMESKSRKRDSETNRAKPRMNLQLDGELDADILDMFDWDTERVALKYRRDLSGLAGFTRAGFEDVHEFDRMLAAAKENMSGKDARTQAEMKESIKNLEIMRDTILARYNENMKPSNWDRVSQNILLTNFGNLMANTGFLMLSELGGIMARVGPIRLFQAIPEVRKYYKGLREGDPEALNQAMALGDVLMGHGGQQLRSRLGISLTRLDVEYADLVEPGRGALRKFEIYNRKQGNAVARFSGLAPLTEGLRLALVQIEADNWVKAAKNGRMRFSKTRMEALGITEEMWDRIAHHLRQMPVGKSPDTGRSLNIYDLDDWIDGEAANVFVNALDRMARTSVLEGDLGHMPFFIRNSPIGRLMFQFFSFPINAFTKHTGMFTNHRDSLAVSEVILMSLGGMAGYQARVAAQAYGISDENERQDFLEERMTPLEFGKSAVYYGAHMSLIPNVLDLGLKIGGALNVPNPVNPEESMGPIFTNTRASGLASGASNPTLSGIDRRFRSIGNLFADEKFSEQDVKELVKAWAPMGNFVVAQAAIDHALSSLPQESE